MVDNPTNLDDGEGRYASRSRINRKVIVFTSTELGGNDTASISTQINGKLGRLIVDASRCVTAGAGTTDGSIDLTMDLQEAGGGEYKFCDTIGALNFTATANTAQHFQMSEGSNQGVTGSDNALHFSVTAPGSSTSGGVAINEPAAWNGLLTGYVNITVTLASGTFDAGTGDLRVVIIYE